MFILGERSRTRLVGVHPDLVLLVGHAIQRTAVDFTILEGVRTMERQKQLLAAGASQTLNSRHLTGHAVDLGAFVDGQVRWDWGLYYEIARAMASASLALRIPVRWGGTWSLLEGTGDPEEAVADYVTARRAAGLRAFIDGPHYEILK